MICNFRLFWLIYLFYLARLEPFNIPMLTQYHSLHVVLILYIIFMKGANISGIEYKWMNCIFNIAGKMLLMWFCIIPGDHSCTHWNHEISLSSLLSPFLFLLPAFSYRKFDWNKLCVLSQQLFSTRTARLLFRERVFHHCEMMLFTSVHFILASPMQADCLHYGWNCCWRTLAAFYQTFRSCVGTHAVSSFLSLCSQGTTLILWVPLIVMSVVEFVVSGRCCAVSVSFIRRRTRIHCETRSVCNTMVHVITRTAYTSLMSLYSSIASLHTSCLSVTIYTDNFVKPPPLSFP